MEKARAPLLWFVITAVLITAFLYFLNALVAPTIGGDTEWYVAAANGDLNQLIEPYSTRLLHPFLAGSLHRGLGLDMYWSFFVLAAVSILLFFSANIALLKDTLKSPLLTIPLFLTPYFFNTVREVYEPDPLYLLLLAVFFLFVLLRREPLALISVFFLFIARESTIVLGLIYSLMSWLRKKRVLAAAALVVVVISFWLSGIAKSTGQPNVHNLSGLAYPVLKLSYNFATNVVGLKPWVNGMKTCEPAFEFALPPMKFLGNVRAAGICGWDFSMPLKALTVLLSIFGITPLIFFYLLSKRRKDIFDKFSFGIALIIIAGITHYFLGIFAGTGVERIVGYSWPVFLIATPLLFAAYLDADKKIILKLSVFQIIAAWLPFIIYRTLGDGMNQIIAILAGLALIYLLAFRLIKKRGVKTEADLETLPKWAGAEKSLP